MAKPHDTSQPDTRQRILAIAADLFARQGYTGTSIADIARELGTTTAALYYHFPSKSAILGGLLAGPITGYTRLLDSLDSDGGAKPGDLLGAIIDITADSRDLALIFDRDPAARLAVVTGAVRTFEALHAIHETGIETLARDPVG